MIEEIDGFIPTLVMIGDHVEDVRYFRVLPRIGEAVQHVDGGDPRRGCRGYRVVDIWHYAWHPTDASDADGYTTIVLDDPQHPGTYGGDAGPRLHEDDIDLLATRIAQKFEQD